MAIPTSITDLDANEAMNSPAGSDNVGGTLDNYLRAHAMIIRRQFSKGANVNSASTTNLPPDCSFLNVVKVVSTINAFSNAFDGRIIYIKFEGGITLAHSASLVMPAGVDVVTKDGDVAVFVNESSGVWRCVSYPRGIASTLEAQALTADDVVITPKKLAAVLGGGSLTPNGYVVFPVVIAGERKEVIIQWGTATASNFTAGTASTTGHATYNGNFTATFPIAFPAARIFEVAHCAASAQSGAWAAATAFTTSSGLITIGGPVIAMFNPNGSMTVKWLAIGY